MPELSDATGGRLLFGSDHTAPSNSSDGATAVLKPTRTVRTEVSTSSGDAQPIDLVAGEDHVLSKGAW